VPQELKLRPPEGKKEPREEGFLAARTAFGMAGSGEEAKRGISHPMQTAHRVGHPATDSSGALRAVG
jgi:hypothetical protein